MTSVVPHVGTWIEIDRITQKGLTKKVVPHVGTWIEIMVIVPIRSSISRASRRHVD